MKIQTILAPCLSLLFLATVGCSTPGYNSNKGEPVYSGINSAGIDSSFEQESSSPDSSPQMSEADANQYKLQSSGQTPTGLKMAQYAFVGRDSGNSPDQIEEIYLSSEEGWKICWNDTNWTMDLYQTVNGGRTWKTLNRKMLSKDANGVTFLNRKQGYISFGYPPAYGQITLNSTIDSGSTWSSLNLTAPKEYKNCTFYTFPPVFFSDADGLIITHYRCEQKLSLKQLVFVTHDAGKSWKAAESRTSDGTLSWDCVKLDSDISHDKPSDTWQVTFGSLVWESQNGTTWETVK